MEQENTGEHSQEKEHSETHPSTEEGKPVHEKQEHEETKTEQIEEKPKKPFKIADFYYDNLRKLMVIPFTLLILALIFLPIYTARTGSFINKDVSLKGGVSLTITTDARIDTNKLQTDLLSEFSGNDINVISLKRLGKTTGIIVNADIDGTNNEETESLLGAISKYSGIEIKDYTTNVIGPSLGQSFFKEIIRAVLIAFVFMGIVVLLYFRNFMPSLAVILAAFSDIVVTLAIVNLTGMRISTAGIAAFLMLIGYSVDTNILLTTKLIKKREGTLKEALIGATKTGVTMVITTLAALIVAIVFSPSIIIKQIMVVLLIGLIVDFLNTWLQNAGILKTYIERKYEKD